MKLSPDDMKKIAATEAVKQVENGMIIGLGTGSTANFMIAELGRRIREDGLKIQSAVATSKATTELARQQKIPLVALNSLFLDPNYLNSLVDDYAPPIDIAFDGADEVFWDDTLKDIDLMKGMGGALLQEKMIAGSSRKLVIMADNSKLVSRIGERSPMPIEVMPFAYESALWQIINCFDALSDEDSLMAAPPRQRMVAGKPFVTDQGNSIIDIELNEGEDFDLIQLESMINSVPGVVATGLFLGMAHEVILVDSDGEIQRLESSFDF